MENFIAKVEAVNGAVNSFAWGPLMLLLLVGTGVFLTFRVHWLQVTHFGRILKNTVGTLFQKKAAREQYRIELWQWTVSSLQAAANIAEGISKCFAQSGPYGFITSALVAAAGAAQIATIIASKPQPPAFATGGVVPGNSYTGDRVSALVNSGEMILTRQQQARLFDMANGNGGGETNITVKNYRGSDTEVTANVTGHDIELIIDKRVNESMAAGRYNKSYGIMQNNYNGTRYTN